MYRGEIQNDSIGGNYNRSLDYTPSIGGLGYGGRRETRNFAVGAPLRGAGIGRCEEDEYNCCGLYGRGENEEMEDDPCWDGYEMIGTKMKKGREVPNCVPVGGDDKPAGAIEVPNMEKFVRLFSLGNKKAAEDLDKAIYGNGKPFTNKQLTKIILDKNKVIADLEENAYGGGGLRPNEGIGDMFERMRQENKDAERKRDEEDARSRAKFADFDGWWKSMGGADFKWTDLEKAIEEHNRKNQAVFFDAKGGADFKWTDLEKAIEEHNRKNQAVFFDAKGEGFWDDVKKGLVKHNERKKSTPISKEDWKKQMEDFKAPTENWGADELDGGGVTSSVARPYVTQPPRPLPVQAVEWQIQRPVDDDTVPIGERAPSDEQQDILEKALKRANKVALEKKGWSGINMTNGAMNGFIIAFRQAIRSPPELLEALRMNEALVRQLHELAPAERDSFIPSMVGPISHSLSRVIREQGSNYDAVYREIKRNYGGAAPKVEAKPSPVAAVATALQPVRTAIQNGIGDAIYGAETDPRKQKKGLLGISEEGKEESKKKVIKNIVVPAVTLFNDTWDAVFDPEKLKKRRFDESVAKARAAGAKSSEEDGYIYKRADGKYTYENATDNVQNEVIRRPRGYKRWVVKNAKYNTGYWSYDVEGPKQGVSPYIKIPNPIKEAGKYYTVDELKQNNIPYFIPVSRVSDSPHNEETWRGGFEGDEIWVPEDKAREIYQALNQYKVKRAEEKERAYYESLSEVEKKEYRENKALEKENAMTEAAKAKVEKDIADEEAKENPDAERLAKMKAAQERVRVKAVDNFWKGSTQAKKVSERIYNDKMAKDVAEREAANAQEQSDAAESWKAMTPAERSAQIDAYRKDLQEQGFDENSIEDMVSQIGADQSALMVGQMGGGKGDEDEEEVDVIEVILSKMERYFVDAPPKNEKGERVGLPLGPYKKAISGPLGIGNRRVYDTETEEELGLLKDPEWKKLAMKVLKMEKGWRDENLKKLGYDMEDSDADSDELVGEGAIEWTLAKAGKSLFNPTGDMTKAGIQTFTPDYDAYGATVEQGRLNAFNLSRSMYNQQQAIELPDFDLIEDDISLRFYLKDDEDVIMVGIRGTDVKSWTDLYTWAVIGAKQDFRMTTRFQDDLQKLMVFQKQYPMTQYYYVGVGSSLAGSIADRFLDMGLIDEAITYNPSIEKKYILDADIHNHRVYLDTDPLFILMGQYAPNVEIRKNASRADFYNPSKEKDYLIASHSIFPVYNAAFEGGGMMGAGKTYTIEEWKAIFDAKLEQKRQQIEAREAKKKQTAKAKRERAKAVRDGRDEPPPLETPATFRTSRVMKATPPREPEPAPPAPKKRKPRFKIVAPASARVELRQELVAEQPRKPEGEFAQEAEPLQLVVAEIERQPQRAYMRLMKSPMLTDADRQLMMNLQSSKMAPMRKVKLLARSGLARKLMEILGIDESAFQSQRARARIADTMEKRVAPTKVRDVMALRPIMDLFDKQEAGFIRFCATKTKFADIGTLHNFITGVAPKFARCAVGAWVVTEKLFASGEDGRGLASYNCDGRNEPLKIDGVRTESYGGSFSSELTMNLTGKEEDDNVTSIGFFKEEPLFGLNFASPDKKGQNFFFSQMAEACMKLVEKIDGIQEIQHFVRGSGFGRKRQAVWNVLFDEIVESIVQSKPKPAVRQKIAQDEARKVRNEIAPKVKALIVEFKDVILARGDLMVERVIESLTPAQKGMLEAEVERIEKSKSKPEQIKSKKKRLEEVEAQLGVIERMDSSMMRRYLMPDVVGKEDKIAAKAPSLRAERDKLKREIAALEK